MIEKENNPNPKKFNSFSDITKKQWWKFKKMNRKEYGKTTGLCLLLGILIPPLFWAGIVSGIIWIYKVVKKQE